MSNSGNHCHSKCMTIQKIKSVFSLTKFGYVDRGNQFLEVRSFMLKCLEVSWQNVLSPDVQFITTDNQRE
jgi:hypothetical protein